MSTELEALRNRLEEDMNQCYYDTIGYYDTVKNKIWELATRNLHDEKSIEARYALLVEISDDVINIFDPPVKSYL